MKMVIEWSYKWNGMELSSIIEWSGTLGPKNIKIINIIWSPTRMEGYKKLDV